MTAFPMDGGVFCWIVACARLGFYPKQDALYALGALARLSRRKIQDVIDQTRAALSRWPHHAKHYGVPLSQRTFIASRLLL